MLRRRDIYQQYNMKILHLFSGYNTFSVAAHNRNHQVTSLDIKNYKNCPKSTITNDFLDFDFYKYSAITFDFILVGFPCTTFSKASGGHHFKNNVPVTQAAHNSILMINRLKLILDYFECNFMIENPTSALFLNEHFLKTFQVKHLNLIRVHQFLYGHDLFKQTDLLTSKNILWLDNTVHRINGKVGCVNINNLSLKKRQSYPPEFCNRILDFIELQ